MAEQEQVNRQAWAALVSELLRTEAHGNQTLFARKVDVTPRTVSRWLNQETNVSEQSVRAVARALDRNAADLLVKVGFYTSHEAQGIRDATRNRPHPNASEHVPGSIDPLGADLLPGETPDQWEVRQKQIHIWSGNPLYTKEARASLEEAIERAAASMRESEARRNALKEQMRYLQDKPGA